MKKQNFCYSRFLSIILSLALLCSALVFPVSVNAATTAEEKTDAVKALKTAWQKLENERKGTEFMYPNSALSGSTWIAHKNETAGNAELEEKFLQGSSGSDVEMFGTKYTTLDTADSRVTSIVGTKNITLFFGADSLSTDKNIYKNQPVGSIGCSGATGFYVYVSVTKLTKPLTIKFGHKWSDTTGTEISKTINEDGLYRLTDKDFYTNGVSDILNLITAGGSFEKLRFELSGDSGAEIKVGAIHWESNEASTVPDNIDKMSAEELYSSASAVDLSDSSYITANVNAFKTALAAFKKSYADLSAIIDLKNAWTSMTLDPVTIMSPSQKVNTKVSPAVKSKEDMFVSTNGLLEEEKSKLGAYYATVNTGVYNRIDLTKASNSNWTDVSIADYSDILLNIRVDSLTGSDYIKADIQNSAAATGVQIDIDESMVGQWITLSAQDIFGKSFAEIKSVTNVLKCFLINTNASGSAVLKIGSLMGVVPVELPAESGTWNSNEWVLQAMNLDISEYNNTEAFTAALENAIALYSAELFSLAWQESKSIERLMSPAKKFNTRDSDNKTITTDDMYVTTADLTADEKEMLGHYYANINIGEFDRVDITLKPTGDWDNIDVSAYSDFYINIKVNNVATDGYIYFNLKNANDTYGNQNIKITTADAGKWKTLSLQDITGKTAAECKEGLSNSFKVLILYTNLQKNAAGNADISIGSFFGVKGNNTLPTGCENWTVEKWVQYSSQEIFEGRVKPSESLKALLDANCGTIYNGDFTTDYDGFTVGTASDLSVTDGIFTFTAGSWQNAFNTYFCVKPDTDYVLNYRYKVGKAHNAQYDGFAVGLQKGYKITDKTKNTVGNLALDYGNVSVICNNAAPRTNDLSWIGTNATTVLATTETDKWVNVAIKFNSGNNRFFKLYVGSMGAVTYGLDYFSLEQYDSATIGDVTGNGEIDICDLVKLKKFTSANDIMIVYDAANVDTENKRTTILKDVEGTIETQLVDDNDFTALRSTLLYSTF